MVRKRRMSKGVMRAYLVPKTKGRYVYRRKAPTPAHKWVGYKNS